MAELVRGATGREYVRLVHEDDYEQLLATDNQNLCYDLQVDVS